MTANGFLRDRRRVRTVGDRTGTRNGSKAGAALVAGLAVCLAVAWPSPAASAADEPEAAAVAVPFELLKTRHLAVQVRVNGKGPYRVIFDTGSPVILLSNKVARESGLLDRKASTAVVPFFGAVSAGQVKAHSLDVGGVHARDLPVIVMDHPTVELMSHALGPIDGIVGFPFFARYRMTIDYQARQLTFIPSGYQPRDIFQMMSGSMTALLGGEKPRPEILSPAGPWGLVLARDPADDDAGVRVRQVWRGSAAERAGVRPGDRLLEVDGRWTDSIADAVRAIAAVAAGKAVPLVVRRDGRKLPLTLTPAAGL